MSIERNQEKISDIHHKELSKARALPNWQTDFDQGVNGKYNDPATPAERKIRDRDSSFTKY